MTKVNSPQDAEAIIQKLPCDMGIHRTSRKCTLDGPEAVTEDFSSNKPVLIDEVYPDEFSLEETQRRILENTRDLITYQKPVVSVGGDHSVSFPVIKALKHERPDMELVWLDAHLDLKEKLKHHVSHDVVVRELIQQNLFNPEEVTFVGTTRIDQDEEEFLQNHEIDIYEPDNIEDLRREFENNEQPRYLSIDIDVLKKSSAPGTGYPDGELSLEQVKTLIHQVSPTHGDIVEVAPELDNKGKTTNNAGALLSQLLKTLT
jgi:arginase family enzyme